MLVERNFSDKTLKEIRWWAWAAAVLPMTALAGFFFVWVVGTETELAMAIITGAVVMFSAAVTWWWWAIFTIARIIKQEDRTIAELTDTATELRNLRNEFAHASDK